MFNYEKLYTIADRWTCAFNIVTPFPHVVLDRFLSFDSYDRLFKSFPPPGDSIWKSPSSVHTQNKMVTRRGDAGLKELLFHPTLREILHEFNSGLFLHFLERLTGITGLLPDPYFAEGGFHCSGDGGFLDIHADFSHHDSLGLERRLNLLLYLNGNWQREYGGDLCLYDEDLTPVVKLAPIANRCVIFETSETSFHGHPTPMTLPPGVFRKSLALYYYSVPRPARERRRILFPEDPAFEHEVTAG